MVPIRYPLKVHWFEAFFLSAAQICVKTGNKWQACIYNNNHN